MDSYILLPPLLPHPEVYRRGKSAIDRLSHLGGVSPIEPERFGDPTVFYVFFSGAGGSRSDGICYGEAGSAVLGR